MAKNQKISRVCFVAFEYFPGQGATALYEYSRNLAKLGMEVTVVAAARPREKLFEIIDNVQVYRIRVKNKRRVSAQTLYFIFKSGILLRSITKIMHPDLIHVFSFPGCLMLRLYLLNGSAKWIYDIRSGAINERIIPVARLVHTLEASLFDGLFVLDVSLAVLSKKGNTFKIPMGVDLSFFHSTHSREIIRSYDIGKDDIVLIYSGSLGRQRKVGVLISAFAKSVAKLSNLKLLLVGSGDDFYDLRRLAEQLGITDKVYFLGYRDYRTMPEIVSSADIALAYVPISSGFDKLPPLKLLEYLSCEVPVIATNTTANKEIIKDGFNGVLANDDVDSMSRAIVELSLDLSLRLRLSEDSRNSIRNCGWQEIVNKRLVPAYTQIARN